MKLKKLVINCEFLLLFVCLWSEIEQEKHLSLTLYHLWISTSLIFIFTTKRTGISRFSGFPFSFSFSLLCCLPVCLPVCVRVASAELMKWRNPHPPNRVWGCICIDYSSLFFSKHIVTNITNQKHQMSQSIYNR